MRFVRTPARALLVAAAIGSLVLTGCSSTPGPAPSTSSSSSTPAVAAPAGADGYGIPSGTGAVSIELWTDLSCPYCRQLEEVAGSVITDAVASGAATLTIHPLNFVSTKHGDTTAWSTRGANALAAALDAGDADAIPALYAALQQHQTMADGQSHPTDEDVLAFAAEAGVTSDIADAVTSQRFADWVDASNEYWLGRTIAGTDQVVKGVPVLVVNGTVVDVSAPDVPGTLQKLIAGA